MSLYQPQKVGRMLLKHRVVLPPLTRCRADDKTRVPNDMMAEYYRQRSQEPGTLLISEASPVSLQADGYNGVPCIFSAEQVEGWKKIANAVHSNKSFLFVQLWYIGRSAIPRVLRGHGLDVVSASAVPLVHMPGFGEPEDIVTPRALTKDEILQLKKDFVNAANNAIAAGADGVEIHGANGYIFDQFLHENVNHRTDEYGGSIENRARLLLEVIDEVSAAIGPDRVGVRISPWGDFGDVDPGISPIPQWSYLVAEIERRAQEGKRIAYIHAVEPRISGVAENTRYKDVKNDLNEFITDIWKGIFIRCGALADTAEKVAEAHPNTLVAIGRYFISNADIVSRLRNKQPLTKYKRELFYTPGPEGYIDYPNYQK